MVAALRNDLGEGIWVVLISLQSLTFYSALPRPWEVLRLDARPWPICGHAG